MDDTVRDEIVRRVVDDVIFTMTDAVQDALLTLDDSGVWQHGTDDEKTALERQTMFAVADAVPDAVRRQYEPL